MLMTRFWGRRTSRLPLLSTSRTPRRHGFEVYKPQVSNKQIYYRTSGKYINIGKEEHYFKEMSHISSVPSGERFTSLPKAKAVTKTQPKSPKAEEQSPETHLLRSSSQLPYFISLSSTTFTNPNLDPSTRTQTDYHILKHSNAVPLQTLNPPNVSE